MKEKDLLKALKAEVTSNMPNVLNRVMAVAVTPEENKQLNIQKEKAPRPAFRSKFVVAMAVCMVIVFAGAAALPFIINARTGSSNSIQTVQTDELDGNTSE